jgi:DNA end-binding protein Ku
MASSLVDNLSAEFKPDKFSDEYQEQLRQLVAAKLEQGDALDTAATFGEEPDEGGAEVVDLMEALRRSVEANRSKRASGSGGRSDESAATTATKKTAAKKTAAKKTAATKSSATKSAAKTPANKATTKAAASKKAPAKKTPPKKSVAKKSSAKSGASKKAS